MVNPILVLLPNSIFAICHHGTSFQTLHSPLSTRVNSTVTRQLIRGCNLLLLTCVLDQCNPLVLAFHLYSRFLCGCLALQAHVRAHVIVVNFKPHDNWTVLAFYSSNYLFPIPDFSVHPLHLIVVNPTVEPYVAVVD